jgi:hypothetical protein
MPFAIPANQVGAADRAGQFEGAAQVALAESPEKVAQLFEEPLCVGRLIGNPLALPEHGKRHEQKEKEPDGRSGEFAHATLHHTVCRPTTNEVQFRA